MEGTLAILGFWLFMIALVMKKPLMTLIEKSKDSGASNNQVVQRLQQLELLSQTMAKDLSEIRQLMQAQSANNDLLKLKEEIQNEDSEPLLVESSSPSDELGHAIDKNSIRFERVLPAEMASVWKYLSDPGHMREWLGDANVQPSIGGRVEINFDEERRVDGVARIRGLVNQYEAPNSIAYSWNETQSALQSNVSFELSEHEQDTRLVLVHSGLPQDKLAEFLAMWHARLDLLMARLKNLIPPDFAATFRKVLPIYSAIALTVAASAAPASAAVSEDSYQVIRTERSHLLTKYDNHWRDADELEKEIVRLKHENTASADQTIDQLDKKLKNEYRDLHQIELDISALDKALL